jgi:hypothetical protein
MGTNNAKINKQVEADQDEGLLDFINYLNVCQDDQASEADQDELCELGMPMGTLAKTKQPATLYNDGRPWQHSARKLGELLLQASPSERESARVVFREKRMSTDAPGLLDALPPGVARHAFESGWLGVEDAAISLKAARFDHPLEDLFKKMQVHYGSNEVKAVPANYSSYKPFERLLLMGLLESWGEGYSGNGLVTALRMAAMSMARDPSLLELVDRVAVDFGQQLAKRIDLENPGAETLTPKLRSLKQAYELVGVSAPAMAKAVAGLAVFSKSKAMREMLAGSPKKDGEPSAAPPGQQAWMQALRGSIANDDARVSLLIIDAAKADGVDLLGEGCRWKCASAMRSAMGLACELGSIECAAGFGERGAASGVVVVDGRIIDAANPLLSLVERCLAGYLNPKGGVDAKVWGRAFARVFMAIGKEVESMPESERMMEEMGKKIEMRPGKIQKSWNEGVHNINLGSHAGAVLDPTAVSAVTAMIERALMARMELEPQAPAAGVARARVRVRL